MNKRWSPNATVAAVVPHGDRFLMVEERDRDTGATVFNQPAGHLEASETLCAAVEREVLEETRWLVEATGYLGVARYPAPNGITYLRHSFLCQPLEEISGRSLDDGIIAAHWMTLPEIEQLGQKLRSPLIVPVIQRYLDGLAASLQLVIEPPLSEP